MAEGAAMTVETLLSRLDKVRRTGPGRWIACCPAHEDRSPSLAVRELDDGRVLLHCFSSCSVEEVLAALGLTFDDLFPERPKGHHVRRERRPFSASDVLRCLSFESIVILSCGVALLNGKFTEIDRERLSIAVGRFQAGLTAGGIDHAC
jgi:hypothetical protein